MQKGLILIVIALSIVIVGIVAVWPAYQTMQASLAVLATKESELETKEAYYDNIDVLSGELEKYADELAKIDSAFPKNNSPASLFQFIQKTGSENGMILKDIGSFSVNPSLGNPRIKEIEFDFTVLGNYSAFRNFLGALEKSSRLIDVRNISIPQEKKSTINANDEMLLDNGGVDAYPFNIKVTTYSY